jgi:Bifunctional DNA primase/polymerase, N-terminal/Primase C terminal 2 (PriCT-2)/Protein of unknown function (DUF3987)
MTSFTSYMALLGDTLIENGYRILPIIPGKKAPGRYVAGQWELITNWSKHCYQDNRPMDIELWRRWPGCAIGLACGTVIGIDIDVMDETVAFGLERLAREMLGDTPAMRIGKAPKRALYYRAEEPFNGRKMHPIEVYGLGSQMVIHAIHPDTGKPYAWPGESLAEIDISRLPQITEAQAMNWLAEAHKRIPPEFKPKTISSLGSGDVSEWRGPSDPKGTLEAVQSALAFIPNDVVDGTSWVTMLHAIKASLGEEGRELWLEWSKSSSKSGSSGRLDTAERRWESARPTKVGAGTIYFLAEQRGWVPEAHLILNGNDAKAANEVHPALKLLERHSALPTPKGGATEYQPLPSIPVASDIMDVGGFLGRYVKFCVETSISPQRFLALGAGLCCVGAVAGRKYRAKTNLRTNLYAISLGGSGSGKDHARSVNKELIFAAGLSDYLGGEELASGSALLTSLSKHPSRLFQIDEMGKFLASVNNKKASPHKLEIWTNLTKLYTSAGGVYLGTEYANQEDRPRVDIKQPCCSVYGVTVPEVFWSALEGGAMLDGSMARFLVFLTDSDYPDRNRNPAPFDIPADMIAWLQAINQGAADHKPGNLEGITSDPKPYIVPTTPGADLLLERLQDDQTEWLRQMRGKPQTAVIARLWENTSKLALISVRP